jgi:hypothetical protein
VNSLLTIDLRVRLYCLYKLAYYCLTILAISNWIDPFLSFVCLVFRLCLIVVLCSCAQFSRFVRAWFVDVFLWISYRRNKKYDNCQVGYI